MKKVFFLFIFLPFFSFSQYITPNKDGIYKSIEELKSNTPSYEWKLEMERVYKKDSLEPGGTTYRLLTQGQELKTKFLRDSIFCVVKDSQIFMNTFHLDETGRGFQKVLYKTPKFYRYIASYISIKGSFFINTFFDSSVGAIVLQLFLQVSLDDGQL